jgi:integrase
VRWVEERDSRSTTLENDLSNARILDPYLGRLDLQDITVAVIDGIVSGLRKAGNQATTINCRLAFVRAVLRRAHREWDWIDRVPSVRRLKTKTHRVRWLTHEETDRLLDELPYYLAAQMRFTLATGLRASNVRNLKWVDVDLDRRTAWVHADESKGKKAIGIPLNRDAVVVIREQQGKHHEFVFSHKGKPCGEQGGHVWREALIRAGIKDFRWHDLRHCWATNHVIAGTPLATLRELGGWAKFEHVLIYAHLAPEHLAEAAGNIETMQVKRRLA